MIDDTTRLSIPEVSRRLGIPQNTLWGRIVRGGIPRYSVDGYHVLVDLADIIGWVDTRGSTQPRKWGANAQRVLALRNEGHTDIRIAATLGISRQRVAQIRKRAGVARITLGTACKDCGVRFPPERRGQNRCVDHRRKNAEVLDIKCQQCGTPFRRRESTIRPTSPGHYCSRACRDQGKRGQSRPDSIPKICTECGSEYTGLASAERSVCLPCRPKEWYNRTTPLRQG